MGRPLIYICAVIIIVFGIIQINLNGRHISLLKRTVTYANQSEMRNMGHAGVEFILNRLRTNPTWRNGYHPYAVPLDYDTASVTIQDNTTNPGLSEDELRLVSRVNQQEDSVKVVYLVEVLAPQLPNIPGALSLTNPNFFTALGGSFYIDGRDESGKDTVGVPGISVIDQESKDRIIAEDPEYQFLDQVDGSTSTGVEPSIEVDPTMDFDPMAQLIDELTPKATRLSGGPFNSGDLGSQNNPGVFLIDDYAKITGNTNGYGIMIVKQGADLDVETTLETAGTLNFYGLVLFEDSWALDGQGNVTFHGSVMVGGEDEFTSTTIDLTGNLSLLYNSEALEFARRSMQGIVPATIKIKEIYE